MKKDYYSDNDRRFPCWTVACFCNYSTLFLIFSLIADAIYDFFSDDGSYFFHSSIKSTLFAVKDLLRLDDKQNNNGRW